MAANAELRLQYILMPGARTRAAASPCRGARRWQSPGDPPVTFSPPISELAVSFLFPLVTPCPLFKYILGSQKTTPPKPEYRSNALSNSTFRCPMLPMIQIRSVFSTSLCSRFLRHQVLLACLSTFPHRFSLLGKRSKTLTDILSPW